MHSKFSFFGFEFEVTDDHDDGKDDDQKADTCNHHPYHNEWRILYEQGNDIRIREFQTYATLANAAIRFVTGKK